MTAPGGDIGDLGDIADIADAQVIFWRSLAIGLALVLAAFVVGGC